MAADSESDGVTTTFTVRHTAGRLNRLSLDCSATRTVLSSWYTAVVRRAPRTLLAWVEAVGTVNAAVALPARSRTVFFGSVATAFVV